MNFSPPLLSPLTNWWCIPNVPSSPFLLAESALLSPLSVPIKGLMPHTPPSPVVPITASTCWGHCTTTTRRNVRTFSFLTRKPESFKQKINHFYVGWVGQSELILGGRWLRGVESTFFIGRGGVGWKEGEMKKNPASADKNTEGRQCFFSVESPNSRNTVRKNHSAFLKKKKRNFASKSV